MTAIALALLALSVGPGCSSDAAGTTPPANASSDASNALPEAGGTGAADAMTGSDAGAGLGRAEAGAGTDASVVGDACEETPGGCGGTSDAGSCPALPSGNNGIAAHYPGDTNIESDSSVIYADGFESYASASQLWNNWSNVYQQGYTSIDTGAGNVFAGNHSLKQWVPALTSNVANGLVKTLSPSRETVFLRAYTKFAPGDDATQGHNGIVMSGGYTGPGVADNGSNQFLADVENSRSDTSEANPGRTNSYAYYVGQSWNYGDHFFPDGASVGGSGPLHVDFGPCFVPRQNFTPNLDRWYSYELMVHVNTVGLRDGRIAIWIDGNLIADFQNLVFRSTSSLMIDTVSIDFYIQQNAGTVDNVKWWDNVVIATSYIGPAS